MTEPVYSCDIDDRRVFLIKATNLRIVFYHHTQKFRFDIHVYD